MNGMNSTPRCSACAPQLAVFAFSLLVFGSLCLRYEGVDDGDINPHSARRQGDDDVHPLLLAFYYRYLGGGGEAQ